MHFWFTKGSSKWWFKKFDKSGFNGRLVLLRRRVCTLGGLGVGFWDWQVFSSHLRRWGRERRGRDGGRGMVRERRKKGQRKGERRVFSSPYMYMYIHIRESHGNESRLSSALQLPFLILSPPLSLSLSLSPSSSPSCLPPSLCPKFVHQVVLIINSFYPLPLLPLTPSTLPLNPSPFIPSFLSSLS